ncbi:hypothetical protein EV702DRAFT_1045859 [Suillus placidus]|uniref:Uncharacterized protein n=1 Tax=Suillus placidus TaxID=48579 RepID=A0A9P7D1K4_9AGAM|nr:hypothetical protein EV702DRAFT_1045859 [Suillus placidus]
MASMSSQASTTPQPSSTSNSNNNSQMMSIVFSTKGSPTLVVAFLAIGLFTMTMAVLFGWRKMNRGRLLVQPARPARPGKKPIVLGEKPTLWDVWTRREEEEVTIDLKWENIMPFCATLFCPIEEPPRPVLTKAVEPQPRDPPRSSFVMTRMSAFRQYSRPTSPPPPPPPEPSTHELDDMSKRPTLSRVPSLTRMEGSSVVMAFTIAMPSPVRKRDNASEASDRMSTPELLYDTELGEYCIGSVEVSCSKDIR